MPEHADPGSEKVKKQPSPPIRPFQEGIALIEGLIAILVVSVGILGIVGLQASMIRSSTEARYRTTAAFAVQQRLGQMWANPASLSGFAVGEPGTDVSATTGLPNARMITTLGGVNCNSDPSCVIVTLRWQLPGNDEIRSVTNVAYINE